ncbi:MAG: CinA family protein [Pseudomonadales bacterium]|jgi:nicotinamide-nucleotide amidase|nr:CinA family protein [Pseudomonadales bacterium]
MRNLDIQSLIVNLGQSLKSKNARMVAAESCTGGGLAQVCTSVAGSSDWFECGFVTYSNESKQSMLDIPSFVIDGSGAVSEQVAAAMAEGALRKSNAQVAVSITGVAGPGGGTLEKPVGTVWFGWAVEGQKTRTRRYRFRGDRNQIRAQAVEQALLGLLAVFEG